MFAKHLSIEKFSATDGTLHYGLLALPEHGRPKSALVHVHGFQGSFYGSSSVEELSVAVTKAGMAFFSIEHRGSYVMEEFTKKKGTKETDFIAGSALERFEDCVYDIDGAVEFMKGLGVRRVVLSGHSFGCQKIVYYAATKMSRLVKAMVLLSPVDDLNFDVAHFGGRYSTILKSARTVARKGRYALMPMGKDPYTVIGARRLLSTCDPRNSEARTLNYLKSRMEYVARIRVPMLVMFGTDDHYLEVAKIKQEHAISRLRENSGGRVDSLIMKGTDHVFHGKRRLLARKVADWMLKNA